MKKLFMTLRDRWSKESPDFWKKILKISLTLGTSAVSVLGADKMFELQSYGVPPIVFTISGYVIVWCAVIGLAAKLTVNK